jgi:NhaP-type Na+/H+ or K+/H+ antiporter
MWAYSKIVLLFAFAWLINQLAPWFWHYLSDFDERSAAGLQAVGCLSLVFLFGWAAASVSEATVLPGFGLQLMLGVVLHDALRPMAEHGNSIAVALSLMAAVVLKSGGDEIDRNQFGRVAIPSLLLGLAGYLFSLIFMFFGLCFLGLDAVGSALLSAILGSTDPAALIPTLRQLKFRNGYQRLAVIATAESALNDAMGAIFTMAVLAMVVSGHDLSRLEGWLAYLSSGEVYWALAMQLAWGMFAGIIGWRMMIYFEAYRMRGHQNHDSQMQSDFALVLAIPLLAFFLAESLHGNGLLAAFITGLLSNFNQKNIYVRDLVVSLDEKIESLIKPFIFMMMGPFISVDELFGHIEIGILVALVFILVVRPVSVWLCLWPTRLETREKMFLCGVRETGVVPVVLAVLVAARLPELKLLLPITAWVVLVTLVVLPAVTPAWARWLKLISNHEGRR